MKGDTLRFLGTLLGLAMVLGLAACNTMEGLGEDVEALGEAIEEQADEASTE